MSDKKGKNLAEEHDINNIFDHILLTEDHYQSEGFKEGYEEGCSRGNQEGYQYGFAQGLILGQELGSIYGTVVAEQQHHHTDRLKRALLQLRQSIDEFSRDNDPDKDIIGAVESIRNQYKRVQVMLGPKKHTPNLESNTEERKDYSF